MTISTVLLAELSITAALSEMGLSENEANMKNYENALHLAKQELTETVLHWKNNLQNQFYCKSFLMEHGVAYTVAHILSGGRELCETLIESMIGMIETIISSLPTAFQTITLGLHHR